MTDTGLDEALAAAEKGIDQNPRARTVKQPVIKPVIEGDPKRLVWVRVVTENEPWSDERPLLYWQDYQVPIEDALVFESRKHAVILQTPNSKGN